MRHQIFNLPRKPVHFSMAYQNSPILSFLCFGIFLLGSDFLSKVSPIDFRDQRSHALEIETEAN